VATITVKAIKASGGDYTTVAAWDAAAAADLVVADEVWKGEMYDEVYDEFNVTIAGSTTDATRYKWLTANSGERHDGTAGTGPRVQPSATMAAADDVLIMDEAEVHVTDIEVGPASGNGTTSASAGILGLSNATPNYVYRCVIHDILVSRSNRGINQNNAGQTCWLNNIVYDIQRKTTGNGRGLISFDNSVSARTSHVIGNTVLNCQAHGLKIDIAAAGTGVIVNVKNNIGMQTGTADFLYDSDGTINTDGNCSEDATADDNGDGTHQISKTLANQFVSSTGGSEDLHIKAGSDCIANGVDLVTTPSDVEIDIDLTDRDANAVAWDIGAHQFAIPQTLSPPAAAGTAVGLAPTLAGQGVAALSPAPAAATGTANDPTLAGAGVAILSPVAAPATAVANAPTLAPAGAAVLSPAAATATAAGHNPTLTLIGGLQTLSPAAAVATTVAYDPVLVGAGAVALSPAAAPATATANAPTLAAAGAASMAPASAPATATANTPTLTAVGVATLSPAAAPATAVAYAPTLTLRAEVSVVAKDRTRPRYIALDLTAPRYGVGDRTEPRYGTVDMTEPRYTVEDLSGPRYWVRRIQ